MSSIDLQPVILAGGSGTRLWPPAMNFPAPPAAWIFASASSTDVARAYSNVVGITPGLRG